MENSKGKNGIKLISWIPKRKKKIHKMKLKNTIPNLDGNYACILKHIIQSQ